MKITVINFNDLPCIARLSDQLSYTCTVSELTKRLELLSSMPHHGLFKIEVNGEIKGWIHLEVVFDLIEKTKLEIKALIVDENARGQGIGKKLIEYAKKWAQARGLDTIYLSCNILRDRTHAFYKREGFSLYKTSHFFELEL